MTAPGDICKTALGFSAVLLTACEKQDVAAEEAAALARDRRTR